MGEAESIEYIGEIMLASGFKPTRLPEIADALLRVPQGKSGESALRMRIAARDGDDATLTRLSGAIDQNNSDPTLLRGAGLALFERAADSRRSDQSVRALEFLDRALRVRPDDAEAAWAYGMLAAGLKRDLPAALERVAVARSRLPANPHLARAAALLHEAAGDTSEMKKALQDALRLSKTPEMSAWAKQRLQ
jgi:tetratricopeptide (TPR) repeat protein